MSVRLQSLFLAFSCAFISLAAKADESQISENGFGGVIGRVCGIQSVEIPPQGNVTSVNADNGVAIVFNNFVNPQDSTPLAISFQVNFEAKCNYAHSLRVQSQSGGMTLLGGTPIANGFGTRRDYSTEVIWAGNRGSYQTNGNPQSNVDFQVNGAATDVLTIRLNAPANNTPLVSGTYSDIIFVNLHGAP